MLCVSISSGSMDEDFDFEDDAGCAEATTWPKVSEASDKSDTNRPATPGSSSAGKDCGVSTCTQKVQGKKRFCPNHHRAFENISRQAMRGANVEDTPESKAFKEIFGYKREPGNQELIDKVLGDYLDRFPSGKEKHRAFRGKVELTQFIEASGSRRAQELEVVTARPLDEEAFMKKCQAVRPWSDKRAKDEWDRLVADNRVKKDHAGPPYKPLRCWVPGWILAEDRAIERDSTFQERRVNAQGKAFRASQDEKEQLVAETKIGFGEITSVDRDDMNRSLPGSALTSTRESEAKTGMDLLLETHGQATGSSASEVGFASSASGVAESVGAGLATQSPHSKKKVERVLCLSVRRSTSPFDFGSHSL